MLDYRKGQLEQLPNVELAFGSELTADEVLEYGFDHVAIATGARWRNDGVGRWHVRPIAIDPAMQVLTPDDVMAGDRPRGNKVVLFDDDHYYMGGVLAELLVGEGFDVTLVTPESRVSMWTRSDHGAASHSEAADRAGRDDSRHPHCYLSRRRAGDRCLRLYRTRARACL